MLPPDFIETPRLILRKPVLPDDGPGVFNSYGHDPEVTRYLTGRPHHDLAETLRVLQIRVDWWNEGPEFSWLITTKAKGTIIGMISACRDGDPWRYSLGYIVARTHWGRGFATEAASYITDTLLSIGVERVWAVVDYENVASHRVLEKAGMRREGLLQRWSIHPALDERPRDCWSFAKTR